jgi:hypothetical protein
MIDLLLMCFRICLPIKGVDDEYEDLEPEDPEQAPESTLPGKQPLGCINFNFWCNVNVLDEYWMMLNEYDALLWLVATHYALNLFMLCICDY